jgi:hypothetical protein
LEMTNLRVLVMVADEGSTGWSLFQYMASHLNLRCFFIRDPPHRLSNLFTNSLGTNRTVLTSVLQTLLVHKFRRAPFGGGKHWKGLKETLQLFLGEAGSSHPFLDMYGEAIARDHDVPFMSANQVVVLLREVLTHHMGPKVEMRRWFTFWDAGWVIDRLWHSMLLAIVAWYGMNGEDAWEVMDNHNIPTPSQLWLVAFETVILYSDVGYKRINTLQGRVQGCTGRLSGRIGGGEELQVPPAGVAGDIYIALTSNPEPYKPVP